MEKTLYIVYILIVLILIVINFARKQNYKKHINQKIIKKDVPARFEEIYNELCSERFETLEELINAMKPKMKFAKFIPLIIFAIFVGLLTKDMILTEISITNSTNYYETIKIVLVLMITFFTIMLWFFITLMFKFSKETKKEKNKIKYINEYKQTVVKKFIKLFNSNLEYKTETEDTERIASLIEKSYLKKDFRPEWYEYDYVSGKIDDFTIDIVDDRETYQGGHFKEDTLYDNYESFCVITLSKYVDNEIVILNEKDSSLNINSNYQYVSMDNQEFENNFVVYAKDEVSAMTFLTHDIMEKLLDFYNKCNLNFSISIHGNQIYILMQTGDLFEPADFNNPINKKDLLIQYYKLDFIITFAKLLIKILDEQNK